MSFARHYVLAAGGTGGHMVPAHVLAEELMARGHHVALLTDQRGMRFPGLFDNVEPQVMDSDPLSLRRPLRWPGAIRAIMRGKAQAMRLYRSFQPSAVIGFGGYPVLPAMLAARAARIPTVIHEQNAVLGRVNRLLAPRVDIIATAYEQVARVPRRARDKLWLVGNPVRAEVRVLRDRPYPELDEEGIFRILVVGGSQGASILSDVVPQALGLLPPNFSRRLQVTQQCRATDLERVREAYRSLGIPAECATYMPDLPDRLALSHLIIARAGASTVAELTVAGRPAILVPLPTATDDHQTANAREMVAAGGARAIAQSRFTPIELGKQMQKLGLEPEALANAAARARMAGRPDAARDLANIIESLSDGEEGEVATIRRGRPQAMQEAFA